MEKQIVYIDIAEIADHPMNSEIYGEAELDMEMVETIKEHGVVEPLHIFETLGFYPEIEQKYTLVSGHRRKVNALEAGLTTLPCIIEYYPNTDLIEINLLLYNYQRVKNNKQIIKEKEALEQKLCQFTYYRQKYGLTFDPNNLDNEVCNQLQILKIDTSKAFDKRSILAQYFNISHTHLDQLEFIYSNEFLDSLIESLASFDVSNAVNLEILNEFDIARTEIDLGKKYVKNCYAELHEIINKKIKNKKIELVGRKLVQLSKDKASKNKAETTKKTKPEKAQKEEVQDEVVLDYEFLTYKTRVIINRAGVNYQVNIESLKKCLKSLIEECKNNG